MSARMLSIEIRRTLRSAGGLFTEGEGAEASGVARDCDCDASIADAGVATKVDAELTAGAGARFV
jgi:hypothetical protein